MDKKTDLPPWLVILLSALFAIFLPEVQLPTEPALNPGFPTCTTGEFVRHQAYTLCYEEKHEQPSWVAYQLTSEKLSQPTVERSDDFRADAAVSTGSATPSDYKGSGYDRGHLAPAADMAWSEATMSESFFMSNMSPQAPRFNRGIWKKLEEQTRAWSRENDTLWVVTGPVLRSPLPSIGSNQVSVPDQYYKIVLDASPPEYKAIGFLLRNEGASGSLEGFAVPIDLIEGQIRTDVFPYLTSDQERELEERVDTTLWFD